MLANNRIYFDNASTTPLDKRVVEVMNQCMMENFGNASSLHSFGAKSKLALEEARQTVANCIHAEPNELFFTSSGTESNNWALKGIAFANRNKGNHIIVSCIEHDCILNACKWLETQGFFITYLEVDSEGLIDIDTLKKFINKKTILVSIMHANNEIGTIQPIESIGKICRENGTLFHTDACQSFGKVPIDVKSQYIDLMTINAHKIYGSKGVGALYIRQGVRIEPLLHGGGQEAGGRSSTENLAGIVGFAKAAQICIDEFEAENQRISYLRNKIIDSLNKNIEGVYFNSPSTKSLSNTINLCISGLEGESIRLLLLLDEKGIAVSTGSACSSNDKTGGASHVLQSIGLNPFQARGAMRISLGRFNTEHEVDTFLKVLYESLNELNPIFNH